MRRSCARLALLCAMASLALATAPSALAAGNAVIKDCQSHGQLTQTYSLGALRRALAVLPASVKQYTNCSDVIQQAILAAGHKRAGGPTGAGSGSGGSFLPTPVVVILVILILAAVTFGALAIRRRRPVQGPDNDPDGSNPPGSVAKTRVMPSMPDRPAPPPPPDEAPTQVQERDEDEPESGH